MNSIMGLHVYYDKGAWAFDDEAAGLRRELFVAGIPEIIEALLVKKGFLKEAKEKGFNLTFSADQFPTYDIILSWLKQDGAGNTYITSLQGVHEDETLYPQNHVMQGWLCPALFKYFETAPKYIFAQVERVKSEG